MKIKYDKLSIELTQDEALMLRAILGGICGGQDVSGATPLRCFADRLYELLPILYEEDVDYSKDIVLEMKLINRNNRCTKE